MGARPQMTFWYGFKVTDDLDLPYGEIIDRERSQTVGKFRWEAITDEAGEMYGIGLHIKSYDWDDNLIPFTDMVTAIERPGADFRYDFMAAVRKELGFDQPGVDLRVYGFLTLR